MKKITILLLGLLLGLAGGRAQNAGDIPIDEAHFSDVAFRAYLSDRVDLNRDNMLSTEERASLIDLHHPFNVRILDGLHYFQSLKTIIYTPVPLPYESISIDLTGCSSLKSLVLGYYFFENRTFSNPSLHIKAPSDCSQLDTLIIYGNPREEDWELPTSLTYIHIDSDSLENFNFNLPNLKCLELNAPIATFDISSASKSLQSLTFGSMRRFSSVNYECTIYIQHIYLHDFHNLSSFYMYCNTPKLESVDLSGCNSLYRFSVGEYFRTTFPLLTDLNLSGCQKLSSLRLNSNKLNELDLSDCSNLSTINISAPITTLKLPQQSILNKIELYNSKLNTLNLHEQPYLTTLSLENDSTIQQIDLSNCSNLKTVNCGASFEYYWTKEACENGISNPSWDIIVKQFSGFGCPALEKLDISGCAQLKTLNCHRTGLHTLDLTETALTELDCSHNRLQQLILSGLYDLETLDCSNNQISSINLNDFWKLSTVNLSNNRLAFISLKSNINSNSLEINPRCSSDDPGTICHFEIPLADSNFHPVRLNAQHAYNLDLLPGFDISKMRRIEGGVLNGKMLTFLQDTVRYEYRCANNGLSAFFALVNDPTSAPGDLPISAANFPDEHFRAYIRTHFDTDHNDSLSDEECIAVTEIDVANQQIKTLQGLHYFVYLKYLNADNNQLTSLDLSRNGALEVLSCNANSLQVETDATFSFDLASLHYFDVNRVKFCRGGTIDGTRLTFKRDTVYFEYLTYYAGAAVVPQSVAFQLVTELPANAEFGGLPISEVNFPDEAFRQYISDCFDQNANDSLSERELAKVEDINVVNMGIKNLKGIEHFPFLERLDCSHNQLTALNLSGNHALQTLYCYENNLFVELDSLRRFDLRTLPDFDPDRAENWKGGIVSGNVVVFIADEVSYAYRHRQAGDGNLPATVSFTLTSPKTTANEYAEAPAHLFSVHPVPFGHTLHIESALNLKSVCLYNMQGRLCARFEHGFDALPTADLEPGLYLLLLETDDGVTYRLKAIKE